MTGRFFKVVTLRMVPYSMTICAERVRYVCRAILAGYHHFKAIAVDW
jgi:cytidine deaminase